MSECNEYNQMVDVVVPGWKPSLIPSKIDSLIGKRCILQPFESDKHSATLFALFKPESWTYLPCGPYGSIEELKTGFTHVFSQSDTVLYTVIETSTMNAVGIIAFKAINPEAGSIEIGYVNFSHLLKRSATSTEAVYLMLRFKFHLTIRITDILNCDQSNRHIFEDLHYRRCEWRCNAMNEPSRRAALRFGFTFEGRARQVNVFRGRNISRDWFSVIDGEWPVRKLRFETWLSPDNFDAQGVQRKRLEEC